MPAYVLSETLFLPLALTPRALERRGRPRGGPSAATGRASLRSSPGCSTGVAILIRPAMLFFLPLARAVAAGWRRHALAAVAFVAGCAVVVAPWTVRNYRVYGRFVLVASEGGVTFWTGNHPLARGEGDLAANPSSSARSSSSARASGLTAEELEPVYYRDALGWIAAPTGLVGWRSSREGVLHDRAVGPSYALHSTRYRAASVVSYLLLLPAAIAGLAVRMWRAGATNRAAACWLRTVLIAAGLLPAGAVPDSRDRSGADRRRRACFAGRR